MTKLEEYKKLKEEYSELLKQPVGNRIKKGGRLEKRIKEVFRTEKANQILTRTNEADFKKYQEIGSRLSMLQEEMEADGILTYDKEDGREIFTIS